MMPSLIATLILAQAPGPVAVEVLPLEPAALRKMVQAEIRVDEDGKSVTYSGVPLAEILGQRAQDLRTMAGIRALSDAVLLVRGSDGYQVAVSAAAVAMDTRGERFLLATTRDGRPIDELRGPLRLIVPGDPKHARWVRNVAAVRLVRFDKLVAP